MRLWTGEERSRIRKLKGLGWTNRDIGGVFGVSERVIEDKVSYWGLSSRRAYKKFATRNKLRGKREQQRKRLGE